MTLFVYNISFWGKSENSVRAKNESLAIEEDWYTSLMHLTQFLRKEEIRHYSCRFDFWEKRHNKEAMKKPHFEKSYRCYWHCLRYDMRPESFWDEVLLCLPWDFKHKSFWVHNTGHLECMKHEADSHWSSHWNSCYCFYNFSAVIWILIFSIDSFFLFIGHLKKVNDQVSKFHSPWRIIRFHNKHQQKIKLISCEIWKQKEI